MGLLLNQLCVLETHDQLEFLLLHTGNLRLVKVLLILLANEALLNLGASAILFFDEVHLALGHGLLLLHLDHVLDLLGTVNLTVFIVVPLLPDHLLFTLGLHRLLLCLQVSHLLVLVDLLIVLLLDIQVHLGLLTLLLHLLLLSHHLMLVLLHHHHLLVLNLHYLLHVRSTHHFLFFLHDMMLTWVKVGCIGCLPRLISLGILLHLLERSLVRSHALLFFESLHS